jgi:hypothetical protein
LLRSLENARSQHRYFRVDIFQMRWPFEMKWRSQEQYLRQNFSVEFSWGGLLIRPPNMEVKQVKLPDIDLRDNIPHYVIGTIKIGEGIARMLDKITMSLRSGGFCR